MLVTWRWYLIFSKKKINGLFAKMKGILGISKFVGMHIIGGYEIKFPG